MHLTNFIPAHYSQWPPYVSLSETQIQQCLHHYPEAWGRHYPEETHLQTIILGNRSVLYRAIMYYADSVGHVVSLAIAPSASAAEVVSDLLKEAANYGVNYPTFGTTRDPFGLGWSGLSSTTLAPVLDHLQSRYHYRIDQQWIVLERKSLQPAILPPDLRPAPEARFEHRDNTPAGEWDIELWCAGELVGECSAWAVPDYFDVISNERWVSIEWIGVENNFQRQGYGGQLLLRQLTQQLQLGMDHIILWTEKDNLPARQFFRKFGFREIGEVASLTVDKWAI